MTDNVGIKTQYDQRRRVHIPEPEFPNMVYHCYDIMMTK